MHRPVITFAAVALLASSAFAACSLDGWEIEVTATDNGDCSTTFTVCVTGPDAPRTCGLSHFSLTSDAGPGSGGPGSGGTTSFCLGDHPNGNQAPPAYCLRLDNLFSGLAGASGGATTFSCEANGADVTAVVDEAAGTVSISGIVYGGEDAGTTYGFGEGEYEVNMVYTGVNIVGDGWTQSLGTGSGSITGVTGPAAGMTFPLFDYGMDPSFLLREDGHRIGDGSWVGRGWLTDNAARTNMAGTQDWLFTARKCGELDPSRTTNPGCWVYGPDPSASSCNGGAMVWKYDCETQPTGETFCYELTLWGVKAACGEATLKGGPGCITVGDVPVPSCDPSAEPCDDPEEPEEPCDPSAVAYSLTQGGWGSAKHYEALACEIIAQCPDVRARIGTVASCYGWNGVSDLGEWVTGDCGQGRGGSDGGFVPSGFNPGENGGSQLIAAILNVEGIACYGFDRVGGDPVQAIGRDWIILSTGQTVGEVIDAAFLTCGAGFAGILGEINESWDEGFDAGTVVPCPIEVPAGE